MREVNKFSDYYHRHRNVITEYIEILISYFKQCKRTNAIRTVFESLLENYYDISKTSVRTIVVMTDTQ